MVVISTNPLVSHRDPNLKLRIRDVTGMRQLDSVVVPRDATVETVARALADRMLLPETVAFTLRRDSNTELLSPERTIGEQVESGAELTLTPRAHLG